MATWRGSWTRYAPLSGVTLILVGIVIGASFQIADWFGRGELPVLIVRDLAGHFGWALVIAIGSVTLLVLAAGVAVAFYLELWWRYRLDREPGGMLRVRRGLLTTRSVSLQESRIRGVNLIEPLGVRSVGAARVEAVATGIGSEQETQAEVSTLLPAAPRGLALQVLERVLGIPADDVPLTAHPSGARTRRLRWAGILAAALAGCWLVLFALGLPAWLLILTAAIFAPAVLAAPFVALDAAANLGHALTDELLASRHGSIRRSTVLLHREGIIGWQLRQSVFQRRLNLASLVAVTAAGRGRYAVVDAASEQIRTLAEQAVADLLEPRATTAPVPERTVGPPDTEGPTGQPED